MTSLTDTKPDTRRKSASSPLTTSSNAEAPSGFILKLYQMVNGAPDEVISWTPSGDAFIIGSDLLRLETETLPQYFRHNRFQSLVRQLNFYSFRKINRERNVWIYKHSLFHRDRPEDLHMVRRRTCPGMDGRKQRFSRFSARKLSQMDDASDEDEEDIMMFEQESVTLEEDEKSGRKHDLDNSESSKAKRVKRISKVDPVPAKKNKETPLVVDTSMVQQVDKHIPDIANEEGSLSSDIKLGIRNKDESWVVSEVAMKLEEHARRALYFGGSRGRRAQSGVVTPPYTASQAAFHSTGVLSYDDEYIFDGTELDLSTFHSSSSLEVVSDGDSTGSEGSSLDSEINTVTPDKRASVSPPVEDVAEAHLISKRILDESPEHIRGSLVAPATVAEFCMSNSPEVSKELCGKILHLISSCESLASEFQMYRAALHPLEQGETHGFASRGCTRLTRPVTVQQIWEREASRRDAIRDFKIFAVNCVRKVLVCSELVSGENCMSDEIKSVLERTADMWLQSAIVAA